MPRNRRRGTTGDQPERGILDERRRLIAAGFLVAAVIVLVILGGILRTSEPPPGDRAPAALPDLPGETAQAEEPVEENYPPADEARPLPEAPRETPPASKPPATPPPASSLDARAAADRGRLERTGAAFTVQLMVACDAENARRNLEQAGEASRLYLLPVALEGRHCYRLCWGAYASRESADRASDLPSSLRSRFDGGQVRQVAEVVR
jgi:septal ring-binding cell division protein DamX